MSEEPIRIVFIGGYTRSGSTLLDRLLGSAPGVRSVGELRQVWSTGVLDDRFCGCGRPFRQCPFWSVVIAEAFGSFDAIDADTIRREEEELLLARHLTGLRFPRLLSKRLGPARERFLDRRARLFRAIASVSGCSTIVDSSKNPSYGVLLGRMPGFDLRTVHLVRDSRATSFSWTREKPDPRHPGKIDYFPIRSPRAASTWWLANGVLMERSSFLSPRRHVRVRYEDLVNDPAVVLRNLARRLEIAPIPLPADGRSFELGVHHSVGGNPMRFQQGPIIIKEDDEWRSVLNSADRRAVTFITWPLLLRHGYLFRRDRNASAGHHQQHG